MCGRVRRICWLESKAIGAADEIQRAAPGRARAAAAAGGGPVSHILQLLDRSLGGACRFTGPKAGIADGLSNFSHPARVFSDPPEQRNKRFPASHFCMPIFLADSVPPHNKQNFVPKIGSLANAHIVDNNNKTRN